MHGHRLRTLVLAAALATAGACGDDGGDSGPYADLGVDRTIAGDDLDGQVDVVRDQFGVPHIYASSMEDLAFAQGYVMAADRLPQMDLFRHFASATLSELFGALDQEQIDSDLEMRMHRMRPIAEETWAELQASDTEEDREIVRFLERFSDGVNQYLSELSAGEHVLDPAVGTWFDASRAANWTPVDSLAIGRLQAWNLSYTDETGASFRWQQAFEIFDRADPDAEPARAARAGIAHDLFPMKPMDTTATIDGFPPGVSSGAPRPDTRRPTLPERLKSLSRRARDSRNGSNNWVVGPDHTDGRTVMANDPHLTLSSPSIFYLVHLTVPDEVDVQGITFPGIPGVILGHNEHLAWGATTANHDVTDFYLEEVVPCDAGGGDCVLFEGDQVPIETWEETIQIGALGTITDSMTVTYERVPHHGPIVPQIADHDLVPRSGDSAISVRYTGHMVTNELRSFYRLWTAETVADGIAAMETFGFGAQNWVFADDQGNIGWTTQARTPQRSDGCYTFDAETNPEGVAPWWVVPGDGSCEWVGFWAPEYVPHAENPAQGYLVTANADPIGATADGDPLDQPVIDGSLLYIGSHDYAQGWRAGRITRRIQALIDAGTPITGEHMADVQADTHSNYGSAMAPHLLAAIVRIEEERVTPGTHADLEAYAASLQSGDDAFLAAARTLLESWTYETPPAVNNPTEQERTDSAATSLFNGWAVFFIEDALSDEAAAMGMGVGTSEANTAFALYERPDELVTGLAPETGDPILCDDMTTATEVESCDRIALGALMRARSWLEGSSGFGSADPDDWRWGEKHTLTLEALIPADELDVPPPGESGPLASGYPRPGDQYSVDASSPGLSNLDFTYDHGPAMRHVTELIPGQRPITRMALPGGQLYDRTTGHFRDLMDTYWSVNDYFTLPWSTDQIIDTAESRWRLK